MRDREGFPLGSIDVATMDVRAVVKVMMVLAGATTQPRVQPRDISSPWCEQEALAAVPLDLLLNDGNLLAGCGRAIASPAGSRR
jgi:hypothetical protein